MRLASLYTATETAFSPGTRNNRFCNRAASWDCAAGRLSPRVSAPCTMPFTRHSTRPTPPLRTSMSAEDLDGVSGHRTAVESGQRNDARRQSACHDLVEVEPRGGGGHLAVGVAGQRLADQIGPVERIVDLIDGQGVEAANEDEVLRSALGGVEESFRGLDDPGAVGEGQELRASATGGGVREPEGFARYGRDRAAVGAEVDVLVRTRVIQQVLLPGDKILDDSGIRLGSVIGSDGHKRVPVPAEPQVSSNEAAPSLSPDLLTCPRRSGSDTTFGSAGQ